MEVINNKINNNKLEKNWYKMCIQRIDKQVHLLNAVGSTNIGKVRVENEDNYLLNGLINKNSEPYKVIKSKQINCNYTWKCLAVFDGMGGGENGAKAALTAAQEFEKLIPEVASGTNKNEIDNMIRLGFLNANNQIRKEQRNEIVCGTTGTVLVTDGNCFKVFHVGDSRAYLIRNRKAFILTKDQTLAQMKTDVGIYNALEEAPEREKHQLTEYIGRDYTGKSLKPIESEWMEVLYGDRILVCTDGLYDMCSDFEIGEIICKNDNIENAIKQLMEVALDNGGVDNLTCILLESK